MKTARRRLRADVSAPPAFLMNADGTVPTLGEHGAAFLHWLSAAHPEIDPFDVVFGPVVDPAEPFGDNFHPRAEAVIAHYCDPAAHLTRKESRA